MLPESRTGVWGCVRLLEASYTANRSSVILRNVFCQWLVEHVSRPDRLRHLIGRLEQIVLEFRHRPVTGCVKGDERRLGNTKFREEFPRTLEVPVETIRRAVTPSFAVR